MVEYHGWFKISESTNGEDEDNIHNIVSELKDFLVKIEDFNRIIQLKPINGQYFLHLAGFTNHWSSDIDEVFDVLNLIIKVAKGSYGLLYIRDDENRKGKDNEFQIYKLARGKIEEATDHLLSPCNPIIEE